MPRGNLNGSLFSATYHECMTGSVHLTKRNQTIMVARGGGESLTYLNILLSLLETIFHRMWQNFIEILSIRVLAAALFSPKICLLGNTVNAHMYPILKSYLYFKINHILAKIWCFLECPCVLGTDSGTGLNYNISFFHFSFTPILAWKKISSVFHLLLR